MDIDLQKIISEHDKWCSDPTSGKMADLSGVDLNGVDLSGVNFGGVDLSEADLELADLAGANLSRANLSKANLSKADLAGANLTEANLTEANLTEANLSMANLKWATLSRVKGSAKGIHVFTFDHRGYSLVCWKNNEKIWFNAGLCRSFPMENALAYWGSSSYWNRKLGDQYVKAIRFMADFFDE